MAENGDIFSYFCKNFFPVLIESVYTSLDCFGKGVGNTILCKINLENYS